MKLSLRFPLEAVIPISEFFFKSCLTIYFYFKIRLSECKTGDFYQVELIISSLIFLPFFAILILYGGAVGKQYGKECLLRFCSLITSTLILEIDVAVYFNEKYMHYNSRKE